MQKYPIIVLMILCLAVPAMAYDNADQEQAMRDSYESSTANKALQDYYRQNPEQAPNALSQQPVKRKQGKNLYRKTFGGDQGSESWGTR